MTVPDGRSLRRWTRRRTLLRSEAGISDLLTDLYMAILTVAMSTAIVLSLTARVGTSLVASSVPVVTGGFVLAPGWLAVLAGLAALLLLVALSARLGPVAVSSAEGRWWLPLVVDRRSLLRPAAARWPAVAAVPGAATAVAVALVLVPGLGWGVLVGAAVAGGATASAGVLAVGLSQVSAGAHRLVRLGADLALAAVPLLGLVLAVLSPPAPTPGGGALLLAAAVATVLAAALGVALDRRLARLPDAALRGSGAVAGEMLGATLSLDTRALGRALSDSAGPPSREGSASMRWLARVPRRWAAPAALVTGDAMLVLRSPRHLVQLVAAAALPALALAVPQPVPVVTLVLLVAGAYAAALAATEPSRRAHAAPALDALLPLGQRQVRRLRLVVPIAVHAVWSLGVFSLLTWRYGGPDWLALGLLTSPVWAAGAVRAAYRPLPDFSGPLIHTPMGAFPPGMTTVFREGPDVVALGTIPVLVALLTGAVTPALLGAQAVLAAVVVAVVARPGRQPASSRASARSS